MGIIESKYFKCRECGNWSIRLLFYPGGNSIGEINDFAERSKNQYRDEKCQVWIIGPPTNEVDEDCAHLTAKVWPNVEKPKLIKPSEFRKHIEFMEENHCNSTKTKDLYLDPKNFGF